ncbi:MAG TPA: hypothetical protein VFS01_06800 [Rhizomicrobium sp.]|jgi:hypothetical protein|nr:hypothetical protein [Rhizomicrobium sp.]
MKILAGQPDWRPCPDIAAKNLNGGKLNKSNQGLDPAIASPLSGTLFILSGALGAVIDD